MYTNNIGRERPFPPPPPAAGGREGYSRRKQDYGPISDDPGQHLTVKGQGPREDYDIDARPNSRWVGR